MIKKDLYKALGMEQYCWGDCFMIDHEAAANKTIELIDKICIAEKLNPLAKQWNEISFDACNALLENAFNFDLAYSSSELMPKEKAIYYKDYVMTNFNASETRCFTNWQKNPWTGRKGGSWLPITDHTFDIAIVLVDSTKLIFTYFISED